MRHQGTIRVRKNFLETSKSERPCLVGEIQKGLVGDFVKKDLEEEYCGRCSERWTDIEQVALGGTEGEKANSSRREYV